MGLGRFVKSADYRVVLAGCSMLLRLYALILIPPLSVSLIMGEFMYSAILGALSVGSFLIGLLALMIDIAEKNIDSRDAMIITALAYVLYAVASGIVFLPATSYLNGFFEAMSGFTTTGLSMLDPDALPRSLLFFRAYTQWIGGAGIIILSLAIMVGPGKAAFRLYVSEFGKEDLVGNVKAAAAIVARIYLILTLCGYAVFTLAGMGYFEALLYVLTTVSTGGFASHSEGIGYFKSPVIRICVVFFMLSGAVGFPAYYLLWKEGIRRFFKDVQLRALLLAAAGVTFIFWLAALSDGQGAFAGIFNALSALTTTGFSIGQTSLLPKALLLLTIILMLIGGSAGSTAGGLKLFRVNVMLRLPRWLLMRAILPREAKIPIKYRETAVSEKELNEIFGFAVPYFVLIAVSTFVISVYGFTLTDAFFESASALGTVGFSIGVTSPSLPAALKILLILDMWAGRLEILPLLVLFYPRVWMPQRSSS